MLANGEDPEDMLQKGSILSEFTQFDMVKQSSGIEIHHHPYCIYLYEPLRLISNNVAF